LRGYRAYQREHIHKGNMDYLVLFGANHGKSFSLSDFRLAQYIALPEHNLDIFVLFDILGQGLLFRFWSSYFLSNL
jgi:hypothetical protein